MSDKYPTVYLQGGDTQAEFVIANPELPGGAYVPVSELRELIEQWREQVQVAKEAGVSYEHWKTIEHKADELEAVLDE